MSTNSAATPVETIDRSRILSASIASVAGAVIANVVAFLIIGLFYDPPDGFLPLTIPSIALFTTVGTTAGAVVFWLLSKRSATPIRTYRTIAVIALILSIIPNILAYFNPSMFPVPGGEPSAFLLLTLFHVIAFAVSVGILTTRVAK